MAIYGFNSQFTFTNVPKGTDVGGVAGVIQSAPIIDLYPPGMQQLSHIESGRTANTWEEHRVDSSDIEEFLDPAFKYLDEATKNYWADIRVPTKDAYRFIRTKIAGASKSLQVWTDELRHGRVQLPVISISRTGWEFNPNKFSPPYAPYHKRFVNPARTRIALYYRPVPYFVEYTLSLWSETKRDAEYILYQIQTRFNSLAEFTVSDGHTYGNVQMKLKSASDGSEKEATAEQHAKVKYEISYTAEAWLSIPRKVMPTILGTVHATEIV